MGLLVISCVVGIVIGFLVSSRPRPRPRSRPLLDDPVRVRRLELELGLREPDAQDVRDHVRSTHAVVRYGISPERALAELRDMYRQD